jgi:hypothetical protein
VTAASAPFSAALGLRVVAVGDVEATALEARAEPYISHENAAWLRVKGPELLAIPEILHVLKTEHRVTIRLGLGRHHVSLEPARSPRRRSCRPGEASRRRRRCISGATKYWLTLVESRAACTCRTGAARTAASPGPRWPTGPSA